MGDSIRLMPLPGVFKPRSDSLMLADAVAQEGLAHGTSVLDLCTGSGLLAITAARHGAGRVVAVDISRRAVAAARLGGVLSGVRIDSRRGDLFAAVPDERFDLIVSNPPYLPAEDPAPPRRGRARAWDAGRSGRAVIDRICREAAEHLTPSGVLLLIHSSVCGEGRTLAALHETGLEPSVVARRRGPLGPLLRERAAVLRSRGLIEDRDEEEILVFRARRRKLR